MAHRCSHVGHKRYRENVGAFSGYSMRSLPSFSLAGTYLLATYFSRKPRPSARYIGLSSQSRYCFGQGGLELSEGLVSGCFLRVVVYFRNGVCLFHIRASLMLLTLPEVVALSTSLSFQLAREREENAAEERDMSLLQIARSSEENTRTGNPVSKERGRPKTLVFSTCIEMRILPAVRGYHEEDAAVEVVVVVVVVVVKVVVVIVVVVVVGESEATL